MANTKKEAKTQNFRNVVVAFQKFGLLPTPNPAKPYTTNSAHQCVCVYVLGCVSLAHMPGQSCNSKT